MREATGGALGPRSGPVSIASLQSSLAFPDSMPYAAAKWRDEIAETMIANWKIWLPAQCVGFGLHRRREWLLRIRIRRHVTDGRTSGRTADVSE